jgi:hypothetical protein
MGSQVSVDTEGVHVVTGEGAVLWVKSQSDRHTTGTARRRLCVDQDGTLIGSVASTGTSHIRRLSPARMRFSASAALAEADDATARLRQTAAACLTKNSNARAAGELLGVHFNTVRYRIRQVEKLLGRPIEERRTHIEMALRYTDAYGEEILLTVTQSSGAR